MELALLAIMVVIAACLMANRKTYNTGFGKRNIARIKFIQAEFGDEEQWNHLL